MSRFNVCAAAAGSFRLHCGVSCWQLINLMFWCLLNDVTKLLLELKWLKRTKRGGKSGWDESLLTQIFLCKAPSSCELLHTFAACFSPSAVSFRPSLLWNGFFVIHTTTTVPNPRPTSSRMGLRCLHWCRLAASSLGEMKSFQSSSTRPGVMRGSYTRWVRYIGLLENSKSSWNDNALCAPCPSTCDTHSHTFPFVRSVEVPLESSLSRIMMLSQNCESSTFFFACFHFFNPSSCSSLW